MSMAEKVAYADVVLDNSSTPEALRVQVEELLQRWRKQTRFTWLVEWLIPPAGLLVAAVTLGFGVWAGAEAMTVRSGLLEARAHALEARDALLAPAAEQNSLTSFLYAAKSYDRSP